MSDNGNELVNDVDVAWGAAGETARLLTDLAVREGGRDEFAEKIGQTVVDQARKIVEGERDVVTGLLLNTVARRNVAQRLQHGEDGTMMVLDMVGLKHLNTFSHTTGDNGLITVAKVLKEFGFAELGRKGDEFYGFVTGMGEGEFETKFRDFIRMKQEAGELMEKETGIPLLSYWDCGQISDPKDLNGLVSRLDKQTEDVKAEVAEKVLQMIEVQPLEQKSGLMMLYFNLKVRAKPEEIAQFARTLDERLRNQYGITGNRNRIDEETLKYIPASLKQDFQKLQERALRELNLN